MGEACGNICTDGPTHAMSRRVARAISNGLGALGHRSPRSRPGGSITPHHHHAQQQLPAAREALACSRRAISPSVPALAWPGRGTTTTRAAVETRPSPTLWGRSGPNANCPSHPATGCGSSRIHSRHALIRWERRRPVRWQTVALDREARLVPGAPRRPPGRRRWEQPGASQPPKWHMGDSLRGKDWHNPLRRKSDARRRRQPAQTCAMSGSGLRFRFWSSALNASPRVRRPARARTIRDWRLSRPRSTGWPPPRPQACRPERTDLAADILRLPHWLLHPGAFLPACSPIGQAHLTPNLSSLVAEIQSATDKRREIPTLNRTEPCRRWLPRATASATLNGLWSILATIAQTASQAADERAHRSRCPPRGGVANRVEFSGQRGNSLGQRGIHLHRSRCVAGIVWPISVCGSGASGSKSSSLAFFNQHSPDSRRLFCFSPVAGSTEFGPHPSRDRAVFAPDPRLWHGAEMAKSRGRTSGCVARRGLRLPRRICATTFWRFGQNSPVKAIGKRMIAPPPFGKTKI